MYQVYNHDTQIYYLIIIVSYVDNYIKCHHFRLRLQVDST